MLELEDVVGVSVVVSLVEAGDVATADVGSKVVEAAVVVGVEVVVGVVVVGVEAAVVVAGNVVAAGA